MFTFLVSERAFPSLGETFRAEGILVATQAWVSTPRGRQRLLEGCFQSVPPLGASPQPAFRSLRRLRTNLHCPCFGLTCATEATRLSHQVALSATKEPSSALPGPPPAPQLPGSSVPDAGLRAASHAPSGQAATLTVVLSPPEPLSALRPTSSYPLCRRDCVCPVRLPAPSVLPTGPALSSELQICPPTTRPRPCPRSGSPGAPHRPHQQFPL